MQFYHFSYMFRHSRTIRLGIFFCDSFRVRIVLNWCSSAGIARQQLTVLTCEATLTMTWNSVVSILLYLRLVRMCNETISVRVQCVQMFSVARHIFMWPLKVSDWERNTFRKFEHGVEKYNNANRNSCVLRRLVCILHRLSACMFDRSALNSPLEDRKKL